MSLKDPQKISQKIARNPHRKKVTVDQISRLEGSCSFGSVTKGAASTNKKGKDKKLVPTLMYNMSEQQ